MQPRITKSQIYMFALAIVFAVLIFQPYSDFISGISLIVVGLLGIWVFIASHFKGSGVFRPPPPKETVTVRKAWQKFVKQLEAFPDHFEGCSEEDINHLMQLYNVKSLPQPYIAFLRKYGRGAKDVETVFKFKYDDLPTIMTEGLEIAGQIPILSKHKIFIFAKLPYESTSLFLYFYQAGVISEDISVTTEDELIDYNANPPVGAFSSVFRSFPIHAQLSGVFNDSFVI